jgi:hypothetical protein
MSKPLFSGMPVGPVFTTSAELVVQRASDGQTYQLQIFPDLFNADLRAAGKPMHFYFLPDAPRMVRDPDGRWHFHFTRFGGALDEGDTVGVAGHQEVAGGVLSFDATLKIPDDVIVGAIAELQGRGQSRLAGDKLFAWSSDQPPPGLGPVPILKAETYASSLSPEAARDGGTGAPPGSLWFWKMEGGGEGSASAVASTAYTALVGLVPAAILEASFQGVSSDVFVHTRLEHRFWMPTIKLTLTGDWKSIHKHLSAAFEGKLWCVKADLRAAYDKAVKEGAIKRQMMIDGTLATEAQVKAIEDRAALVFDKFMALAETVVLKPAPAIEPAAAKADGGFLGLFPGKALALKAEEHITEVHLAYEEELDQTFRWPNVVSGHMRGFFDEIAASPGGRGRYFSVVNLEQTNQKLRVVARAKARWPGASADGEDDPLHSISLVVQYPATGGRLVSPRRVDEATGTLLPAPGGCVWTAANRDAVFLFEMLRGEGADSDQVHLTETVHYQPSDLPDDETRESTRQAGPVVVEAATLGLLRIGPIEFDRPLASPQIELAVTIEVPERQVARTLRFRGAGGPSTLTLRVPAGPPLRWRHRVKVTVMPRPTAFLDAPVVWEGPVVEQVGSCELTVHVPDPSPELLAAAQRLLA